MILKLIRFLISIYLVFIGIISQSQANDAIRTPSIKNAQILARISKWKDPAVGLSSENTIEVNTAADYVTERRLGQMPEFMTRLKVWIHLPGFTAASPKNETDAELDPVGSPFPITVDSRVLGVWMDQRKISIPIYLRPNPNELIERWLHIEVLDQKAYSDTDPACLSVGLELEAVTSHSSHLWTHLGCFINENNQVYASISYSKDGRLNSKKWNSFSDMGPGYAWIDLLKFNPSDLPAFEIRKNGTDNASFYRLKIRKTIEDRTIRTYLGIGPVYLQAGQLSSLNGNFNLAIRRQKKNSNRSLMIELDAKGPAKFTFAQFDTRMGWKLPFCLLEFLNLDCEPTFGIQAFGIVNSTGSTFSFGPQIGINFLEQGNQGRAFGYFRYAPHLAEGSPFSLSNYLFELGFAFDLSRDSKSSHTYLLLQGLSQSISEASAIGLSIRFEVGGSVN